MAEPYLGEIRMFAGNFAPQGWLTCNGQRLSISEYYQLFELIGTTYGGDGVDTFDLPDFGGRIPIHFGTDAEGESYPLGRAGGTSEVWLSTRHVPNHTHDLAASGNPGASKNPEGQMLALTGGVKLYREGATPNAALAPHATTPVGGSLPHTNLMPYLCVTFIISTYGLFPAPN